MLNVTQVETIIFFLSLFLVYVVSVTLAGSFRAWVADRMGDHTATAMGFAALNPLVHIDPLGLIWLFLPIGRFAWGRYVPINPFNIIRPFRTLKIMAAFFSDTLIQFLLCFISMLGLVALFGVRVVPLAQLAALTGYASHMHVAQFFPHSSSLVISVGFILVLAVYLNLILTVFGFFIDGCNVALHLLAERYPHRFARMEGVVTGPGRFLLPLLILILFANSVLILTLQGISWLAVVAAHVLKLV